MISAVSPCSQACSFYISFSQFNHKLNTPPVYAFRGASPGNFDRLRDFYSNERQIPVNEQTLVLNHRSSANILTVAAKFLEGDKTRHPKALQATRPQGLPVELWKMKSHTDQAKHIANSIVERHEQDGVPYGEMACLFRCSKMGKFGSLTKHLQEVLQRRRVPFVVVGGTGIFERETVLDLLAYLNVCVGFDDDSFERVINKPPR